ncbi:hypothetical protein LS48_00385 [Aequorivita aquimaris]|uniref:Uncharacterized protein n=1 Tax=Aequorivita aquimaris TaxID=1548749 RepID=A0A137RLA5_9FLAO|nr:hypothetical protein LS48_00385 [Aequorivita aquimaris]
MINTIEETPRKLPLGPGQIFVGFRSQSLNPKKHFGRKIPQNLNHKNQIRRKIPQNLLPQP